MRKDKLQKFKLGKKMTALCLAGVLAFLPAVDAQAIGAGSSIARGIDVSKHNLAIDWSQVPSSGVSFVFVKAGSTNSGVDPYFDANMRGANAAGLRTGVYLYSYATNVEEAQNEANLLLQWISNYTVSYPVVYDVEHSCHKNMSQEQLQAIINTFCGTVQAAGYYPVVYSYKNMFVNKIGNVGYDKWVAQYSDTLEYDGAAFWQNTSHGSVAGIPTRVDMNYQFKDYSALLVANGFAQHGDQTVFCNNYRIQRTPGWIGWEDKKYHLGDGGYVQKGCWFEDETGRYYLATDDGHALRDSVTIDGVDYYFDENCVMRTGLVTRADGNTYYYDANGALQRNTTLTIEGVEYAVNQDGVATKVVPADASAVEYTYTDMNAAANATTNVNVRNLPGTFGKRIGKLSEGQAVTVTGQCNETGWYRFDYNGQTGYVSNEYVNLTVQ